VLVQVALLAGATLHGLPDTEDAQLGQQKEGSGHDQSCKEGIWEIEGLSKGHNIY